MLLHSILSYSLIGSAFFSERRLKRYIRSKQSPETWEQTIFHFMQLTGTVSISFKQAFGLTVHFQNFYSYSAPILAFVTLVFKLTLKVLNYLTSSNTSRFVKTIVKKRSLIARQDGYKLVSVFIL